METAEKTGAAEKTGTAEKTGIEAAPILDEGCQNCGNAVMGAYCQACGQRHLSHIHPIRGLIAEVFSSVLNIDGRLAKTVKMMVQPGRLTTAYLSGQRIRYISPFRLYLICSILYFAVSAWIDATDFLFINDINGGDEIQGLIKALPRIMFVVVLGFALLFKLLHRDTLYAAHLIFALHVHAVWYLLFTISTLLRAVVGVVHEGAFWVAIKGIASGVESIVQFGVLVFLFMAMRYVYKTSRMKTLLHLFLFLLGYLVIMLSMIVLYALLDPDLNVI